MHKASNSPGVSSRLWIPRVFRKAGQTAAVLALCGTAAWAQTPAAGPRSIDFSNLVVVGDSLSAGMQNFSLLDSQQVHGYAPLVATQAGGNLILPLIPYPGLPNVLQLVSFGPPPVVAPVPGTLPPIPRDNPGQQATDLAVPGVKVADLLNLRPTPNPQTAPEALTDIILGIPGTPVPRSQVEEAVALNPSTVILWIGANDVLLSAMAGDPSMQTPIQNFAQSFLNVMADLSATKAQLIVANVPDVTVAPYFTSTEQLAEESGVSEIQVMNLLGIGAHDYLRPGALPIAFQILQGQAAGPLPATCPANIPGLPITSTPCVMTAAQADSVRADVLLMNSVITGAALYYRATLVDAFTLLKNLQTNGYEVNGVHLTTNFLGGLFTLDGMHPTNTLHALFANQFINTINARFHTKIPDVNVSQVAAGDPFVTQYLVSGPSSVR